MGAYFQYQHRHHVDADTSTPPSPGAPDGMKNQPGPDFSRDQNGSSAEPSGEPDTSPATIGTHRRAFSRERRRASNLLLETAVSKRHQRTAPRWLSVALIIWFGGAAIGIATLPRREGRPTGYARPPAHRPVDIETPSPHDFPDVA